jgi:hypothetical protein
MSGGYVVRCDDYELGPFKDRATAERRLEQVEAFGKCHNDHRIEQVADAE